MALWDVLKSKGGWIGLVISFLFIKLTTNMFYEILKDTWIMFANPSIRAGCDVCPMNLLPVYSYPAIIVILLLGFIIGYLIGKISKRYF